MELEGPLPMFAATTMAYFACVCGELAYMDMFVVTRIIHIIVTIPWTDFIAAKK